MDLGQVIETIESSELASGAQIAGFLRSVQTDLTNTRQSEIQLRGERDKLKANNETLLGQKIAAKSKLQESEDRVLKILGLSATETEDKDQAFKQLEGLGEQLKAVQKERDEAIASKDEAVKTLQAKEGELNLEKASQFLGKSGVLIKRLTGLNPVDLLVGEEGVSIKQTEGEPQPWADFLAAQPEDVRNLLQSQDPDPNDDSTPSSSTPPKRAFKAPPTDPPKNAPSGSQLLAKGGYAVPKIGA